MKSISPPPVPSKKLWIISGPTGIGKTAFAIELAKHFGTEIISADARQFYNELNIGVARPDKDELSAVKHHFIAHKSIHESYSAGRFADEANQLLQQLFQHHDHVVCVGGSGLYIQALIEGLDDLPSSQEVKTKLEMLLKENGLPFLQEKLRSQDPEYFEQADTQNPHRVIRALEVIELSGIKFSILRAKKEKVLDYIPVILILSGKRHFVYDRINARVDRMIENGLLDEVKNLVPYQQLNALNTVGYKELFSYLNDEISYTEAINKIKQHSRNYAKRQETWWRRFNQAHWIMVDEEAPMTHLMNEGLI